MRNRLEVFKASTAPVLDFYREKGILADFQGTESKKIWPHVEEYLRTGNDSLRSSINFGIRNKNW